MTRSTWRAAAGVGVLALAFAAIAHGDAPPADRLSAAAKVALSPTTRGYVVTYFWSAFSGVEDCPSGDVDKADIKTAFQVLKLSPADQAKYLKDDQAGYPILSRRGPNGENVCAFPESVPDPGWKYAATARGLDLEIPGGVPKSQVCAHPSITAPTGEKGVDNQFSRVVACITPRRKSGWMPDYHNKSMRAGEFTLLIQLEGVDDERNDPDVDVSVFSASEPMVLDTAGKPLSDASLLASTDPTYRRAVKGKIVNGVLTTASFADLHIPNVKILSPIDLKHVRLQLAFKPDGTAKGLIGGYGSWRDFYRTSTGQEKGGIAEGIASPGNCPGLWHALQKTADAYPDPKTGQCTMISQFYDVDAIPAFIIDPAPNTRQAGAGGPVAALQP